MKALLHKNFFTLVEVLLAMGICVVGLCSVVVFFPIGANASRNASMASYAANVAEQVLDFAKFCIEADLGESTNLNNKVSTKTLSNVAFRYFTSESGLMTDNGWDPDEPWNYEPTHVVEGNEESYSEAVTDYFLGKINQAASKDTSVSKLSPFGTNMTRYILTMLQTVSNDDFPKVTSEIIPYKNNVFYARFVTRDASIDKNETSENSEELQDSVYSDFDCYASLWAEPILADNNGYENNIPYAVRLHVTVSWPADIPWESRQKRDFTMDVFKQY